MRFNPQLPESSPENLVDTYDTILSVKPTNQKNLLDHIQVGLPNPMDLILSGEMGPAGSILVHAAVEPVMPKPVVTVVQSAPIQPAPQQNAMILEMTHRQPQGLIIEQGVPLSQCKLWDILVNYYANQGVNAWENCVPSFVTSSVYMAEAYADNILAFLNDYYDYLDLSEPLYIVEMATGTGRFSFHLLRELERKLACFCRFKDLKLRYVMTDFTDSNVQFWETHERFASFVERGVLDFAVFNPLASQSFDLKKSGLHLDGQQVKNPLIAIANYFFDSTPVDRFLMKEQRVHEGLVSLERNLEGVDPASYPHISQITTHFEYRQLSHHHYYSDYELNAILNTYRKNLENDRVLFPVGALDVVRNLRMLSNDRLVLLSSDKGYTSSEMAFNDQQEFVRHDGAFSYMVNYDAMIQYVQNIGGRSFATDMNNLDVQTVCLISMAGQGLDFEQVRYVFSEKINRQNPANSLCAIRPGNELGAQSNDRLNYLMAQIRMQMADPFIVADLSKDLIEFAPQARQAQRLDLLHLMETILDNYYHCPGAADIFCQLAPVFYLLGAHGQSLNCLKISARLFGERALPHLLAAHNCEALGWLKEAEHYYMQALQLQPDYPKAQIGLQALQERLKVQ